MSLCGYGFFGFLILAIALGSGEIPGGYRQNAAALWGCFCSGNWGVFWL